MASVISDKFAEVMMSNVRPKAEPIIRAIKTNDNGETTELIWKAKDIKNMSLKQSIDPMGRELPYIELTWTEIYLGQEDFESSAKFINASSKMAVYLTITQNLGFYNVWRTLYSGGITWEDLADRRKTWKSLKNNVETESIEYPVLFLEDKPEINGMTITWKARDFLSFLSAPFFYPNRATENISFFDPIISSLEGISDEEVSTSEFNNYLLNTKIMFDDAKTENPNLFMNKIYVNSDTKTFLKNYLSLKNFYLIFDKEKLNFIRFLDLPRANHKTSFKNNVIFKKPKREKIPQISKYIYSIYDYNDSGDWVQVYVDGNKNPSVTFNKQGEEYVENNPLNYYRHYSTPSEKADTLTTYFDASKVVLSFECLPHFEFGSNDVVEVQSNLYTEDGTTKSHKTLIIKNEITYSGAFRQKIIAHEI